MLSKISNAGLQGLLKGQQAFHKQANKVASSNGDPRDMTRSLVEMKQTKNEIAANAQTIKTGQEILGTILDLKA